MIENKKFIEQLEDSNLDLNTVEEYKSSLDKINNFIALIKNSEFSKEYIEQLSIETKQIESYIDQIKNNTSLARQRISNIKNHANRIKNITLEVVLRNPNLNNLLTNIIKKDDAMKTVETTKKAAEEQISLLNQALESTRDAIEDMNSGVITSKITGRIEEMSYNKTKGKNEESPDYRSEKRDTSYKRLVWVTLGVFLAFLLISYHSDDLNIGTEELYAISVIKIGLIGLLYSQYYFAQKNYRIYSDMLSKYKHIQLNTKILENYLTIGMIDDDLKQQLTVKITDLISSPITTHHFKDTDSRGLINNIIPIEKYIKGNE